MATDLLTEQTVNDLLNFDVTDDEDIFADNPIAQTRDDKATLSPRAPKRKADSDKENDGLGLDEEVKITKKRKQIAKLDEERLLEPRGIPKLRQLARSGQIAKKLRFKGKSHEFSDVAKLLNYYQLWLDDLYPRAKFSDGLQIIEKVGHSKRMQVMRKEWIDEGKPGYARENPSRNSLEADSMLHQPKPIEDNQRPGSNTAQSRRESPKEAYRSIFGASNDQNDMFFPDSDGPMDNDERLDDEELNDLLAESNAATRTTQKADRLDSEGEDDLDALLAEQDNDRQQLSKRAGNNAHQAYDSDDDLDALLAEQQTMNTPQYIPSRSKETAFEAEDVNGSANFPPRVEKEAEKQKTSSTDVEGTMGNDDLDILLVGNSVHRAPEPDLPPQASVDHSRKEPIETVLPPSTPPQLQMENSLLSSSPIPNDIDDLDALFDEHEKQKRLQYQQENHKVDSQESFLSSPIPNEEV